MKHKTPDPKALNIPNICFSLVAKDDSREEEFKKQRTTRGFDESETWSLTDTMANFIIPRLELFQKIIKDVNQDPISVKKSLRAMKLIARDNGARLFSKKEEKEVEAGLKEFSEVFMRLWW